MKVFLFRVPLTSCASPLEFLIAAILFYFLSLKYIDERFVLAGETCLLHTINLFVQAMVKNRTPLNTRGPFLSAGQEILAATVALEIKFLSNSHEFESI